MADLFFKKRKRTQELYPNEVFLDSSNLSSFDNQQFEGRIEKAISKSVFAFFLFFCLLTGVLFIFRMFYLEIIRGPYYQEYAQNNSLNFTPIFPDRGNIYDRNNKELAWNDNGRKYMPAEGLGHLLGYVSLPNARDLTESDYHSQELVGRAGVERTYNKQLLGTKGVKIEEVTASGKSMADYIVQKPVSGKDLHLSIDYRVQNKLYGIIKKLAGEKGFSGGSGVIMDVKTGEILAITSFPEFDSNIMSVATNTAKINQYLNDKTTPLLDRAVSGLYTPGSIFKTFVAVGALVENVITPEKVIHTTGKISVPNPYDKTKETIFKDWKNHGDVDMRKAIAVSSDVYFYEVGGGFGSQKGLGIEKIGQYALKYGLSLKTGIDLLGEEDGVIATPAWKAKNFDGEPWRLGDTYHTAIGQYGTQVTPIQMARAYAAVANNGFVIEPTVRKITPTEIKIQSTVSVPERYLTVVKEGLRLDVMEGTATALNVPEVKVSAKTGTAELGITKVRVNSWVAGYFPSDKPRYSFTIVMERGERDNLVGSVYVMRQLLDWMTINTPEYLKEI